MNNTHQAAVGARAGPLALLHHHSIRTALAALVAASCVPALLVSLYLVWQDYQLQNARIEGNTILLARNLVSSLDRELAAMESGLRVLATSPELAAGDLAGFHRTARQVLKFQIANNFVMTDQAGRQHLNTLRDFGQPLPSTGTPPQLGRVFETRAPVLTDMFLGPVHEAPVIAMGVPVFRGDQVVYSLNTGLLPERIAAILNRQSLPAGWVASVQDSSGTVVARTFEPQRYIGQKAPPALIERSAGQREGTLVAMSLEGIAVYIAFSRSSISDWSVAVAAPQADILRELYRSSASAFAAAALAFILGLALATRLGRRIGASVRALIEPAHALGSGRPVAMPATTLKEARSVGEAMVQASQALAQARHQAHHDALTGLCNRVLFDELVARQIAAARRGNTPLALLSIDLDGFKAVNDLHGHARGDQVLKTAADRIKASTRASDIVARLGGDEFAILLVDTPIDSARAVAEKLLITLGADYSGVRPKVSASIGMAMYPRSGDNVAELLERADEALYKAKHSGKRRMAIAEPTG